MDEVYEINWIEIIMLMLEISWEQKSEVWEIKQNIALANTLTKKPYTLEQPTSIPIKIQGLLGN